jgi:two-component system, cell cycle response regulator
LILTAVEQEESLIEALDAGADDFLNKPLKAKVLAAKMRAGLRVVTLRREIERDQTNMNRFASEFAALNLRLQEMRQADPLTGLTARGIALEWLQQSWRAAEDKTLAVPAALAIRVDQIEEINRTHGRLTGDEILRRVSAILSAGLRAEDKIARYSGSTFILFYARTRGGSDDFVLSETERLRKTVAASRFEVDKKLLNVTISNGLAFVQPVMKCADDLLNAAESALADAGRCGGNCTVSDRTSRLTLESPA